MQSLLATLFLAFVIALPGTGKALYAWQPSPKEGLSENSKPESPEPPKPASEVSRRTELNLLGKTDTAAGESRRNENIQFNLVDNNALKELNVRLGTTVTVIQEFQPDRSYFGAEFGVVPRSPLHLGAGAFDKIHGRLHASHLNSIFSARSFFQVGDVQAAHENDYGFRLSLPAWDGAYLSVEGSQQKIRGSVNGNVLVPRPDERTPLATDPAIRAFVARLLAAYPLALPNRTDINERALNTNAPQHINSDTGATRLQQDVGARDRLLFSYLFTSQSVDAFQLVSGQNPDTDTRAHTARITWNRNWTATTLTDFSAGFDRVGSLLVPEENAVGPNISISGLTSLGPESAIPINRAMNMFRYGGMIRQLRDNHTWTAGFGLLRRQFNGIESDTHRGFFSFTNDFGRSSIENFRLGLATQHIRAIGNIHRGFRNWDMQYYAGDTWRVRPDLTLNLGLRYQPVTTPFEVNRFNIIPYGCDCNNVAPRFGLAYRMPSWLGTLRTAYGLDYGEIFPVTFGQVRFAPPVNHKIVIPSPYLLDPLGSLTHSGGVPDALSTTYVLDPELAVPYSHQYNFTWEPALASDWRIQLGYVGSRSHKLLLMWYTNRSHPVPGIPQTTATVNSRRADPRFAEIRRVINGSRGYFDAARVSLLLPHWRRVSMDAAFWYSKALDLGSSYSNTAYDQDSRLSRSQSEFLQGADMKGPSSFDQPFAFLWRLAYETPIILQRSNWVRQAFGNWNLSAVLLLKNGTPFTVLAGSDAPGYGNVDANGGDRPNLLDPSVLGRIIGDPDTSRERLPRSAFQYMEPTDERGNLGQNTFRKGGIRNVNAAVSKDWLVAGEKRLTFRAESINLLNTPQFAAPGNELALPNFGQITNTLNDGRTLRFMLQFAF
ncbi:MAG: hypothetical protein HUU41_16265 [Bryobacteraceae bacterium]|nr:TonB-dependent receptor [Bryobacterales bacterium]MEB2363695.1 TonB-dependent receptor [Bryobacterales bacterium]NUN02665.1 hypothetical protein [Bryobacteraceae bacterium]